MKSPIEAARSCLATLGPYATGLIILTWLVLATRLLPVPNADYGMFLTVAERLRAGDRLYVDVYENKDPLVHYSLALSRYLGAFGPWLLAAGLVLAVSVSTFVIARAAALSSRASAVAAFAMAPLVVTGASYFAGSSHIPAIALLMGIVAAGLCRRAVITGVLLGILVFTKIVMAPMGLIAVVAIAIHRSAWTWLAKVLATAMLSVFAVGLLMFIRGEFQAYLGVLMSNVDYSQAAAGTASTPLTAIADHFSRVMNDDNIVTLWASLAIALTACGVNKWKSPALTNTRHLLAVITLLFTGYAIVAIALTGLWGHHGLILKPSAVLSCVLLLTILPAAISRMKPLAPSALLAFTYLLAGTPNVADYVDPLLYARSSVNLQFLQPIEAKWIESSGTPTTYARIGDGDDGGHAMGLGAWTLACPRFGQSIWESPEILNETLECLPQANVILITPEVEREPEYPAWNEFLNGVDALLGQSYTCESIEGARICRRTVEIASGP